MSGTNVGRGAIAAFLTTGALAACSGGSSSSAPVHAAAITTQPSNETVTAGQSATFSVSATGTGPLAYQWSMNGKPLAGATQAQYTTPKLQLADSGEQFSVAVSNAKGSVTSTVATLNVLTVPGPAPAPGDLRFKQVDAPSTVNGYVAEEGSWILISLDSSFGSFGSPLSIGDNCSTVLPPPENLGNNCGWALEVNSSPDNSADTTTTYQARYYSNLSAQSSAGFASSDMPFPLTPGSSVITALDIQPVSGVYAISTITQTQASGFQYEYGLSEPKDFPALAATEGAASRVITAVSYDSGKVAYVSYGWQQDTSTHYEVSVVNTSFDNLSNSAQGLADAGYIITAMGGNSSDGLVLVGTRVQGHSAARPLMVAEFGTTNIGDFRKFPTDGYAEVGSAIDPSGNQIWIGER